MRFLSYQQTEYWKEGIFDFDLLAQNMDIVSNPFLQMIQEPMSPENVICVLQNGK